jgi:hypothetical protein
MTSISPNRTKVFVSYSHKDSKYLERLLPHLKYYEQNKLIDYWADTMIKPGANWREEIKEALASAKVAVLLISIDFLVSPFIVDNELPPLLAAARDEGVAILPVILRPCMLPKSLSQFQAVNSPSTPLTKMKGYQREELWVNVAKAIVDALGSQTSVDTSSHEPRSRILEEMEHAADVQRHREAINSVIQGKIATRDFDVFVCYSDKDQPAVKEIALKLKERGILPWLDEWEVLPGQLWLRLIEKDIKQIKSAAVFIGKSGIAPWNELESEAILRKFVQRGCPVIPIILEDAPERPEVPLFLANRTWVDFRKREPDPMERLIWGITGRRMVSDME